MASSPTALYCPYCQHKIDERFSGNLHRTGDPRMKCPKCSKTCIDTFCNEPALQPYIDHGSGSGFGPSLFTWILLAFALCVAIALAAGWFFFQITLDRTVILILLGICVLIIGYSLLPHKHADQKEYDLWLASHRRLSNPDHACSLHLLGYPVPPYYLPTFAQRAKKPNHIKAILYRPDAANGLRPAPAPGSSTPVHTTISDKKPQKDPAPARYHLSCPHCSYLLETRNSLYLHNGKLLNTCPACGEIYADPYGTEPALGNHKPTTLFSSVLTSLGLGFFIALLVAGAVFLITGEERFSFIVLGVGTAVFGMPMVFSSLLSHGKDRKRNRLALEESDRRLRDPSYAYLLKQAGYYIPGRYLPSYYESQAPEAFSPRPLRITRMTGKSDSASLSQ